MIMQRKATDELDSLSAIYRDSLSVNTKIAIFSLKDHKASLLAEVILLTVEYFQLASQALLTQKDIADNAESEGSISSATIILSKILYPGNLFEFGQEDKFTLSVLIIVLACTLLKYLLFSYILFIAMRDTSPNNFLLKSWRWTFRLQGRCIYFFITSFWMNTIIAALDNKIQIFPFGASGTLALFGILLAAEYIFSLFLNIRYAFILQTKSFLSSKDHQTQTITLTQKFAIHFLQVLMSAYSLHNEWIYGALGLLFNILNCLHYFKVLPLYNIKALSYQGSLLMLVTSLNVSCCLRPIIRSLYSRDNLELLLTLWIIFSLLTIKISSGYLNKVISKLVTQGPKVSPSLSIHKLSAIKQIRRQKSTPGGFNDRYEQSYLVNTIMEGNLASILGLEMEMKTYERESINSKQWFNKLFILYLEALLQRFPQNNFIKLQIAAFYAKKLKLYGISMKFLSQLQHVKSSSIALSTTLIIHDIQAIIRTKTPSTNTAINVYDYFKTQKQFTELKKSILDQCKMQVDICKEMTSTKPKFAKIFNDALTVNKLRNKTEKEIVRKVNSLPEYFVEIFALSGYYYSTLNHSLNKASNFLRLYSHKYKKYERSFLYESLACENYYQDNTGYILVSGQKERLGQITFVTNSISNIFGRDAAHYIGTDISTIVPLDFQSLYSLFFDTSRENKDALAIGQAFRGYSYHKEGYLLELDFHLDVFPFLTQGFYFCLIIRPVKTQKEYLLIHENGDIEGATKLVSQQLAIDKPLHTASNSTVFNIRQISEDLADANEAFNVIASFNSQLNNQSVEKESPRGRPRAASIKKQKRNSPSPPLTIQEDKSISKDFDRAMKLYTAFAIEGREIHLWPISRWSRTQIDERRSLKYNCKIETVSYGSRNMKLVILEENKKANANSNVLDEDSPAILKLKKLITIRDTETKFNLENKEEISEENSEDFNLSMLEDEKQKETMNMESKKFRRAGTSLKEAGDGLKSMGGGDLATTEGNLLSPISHGRIQTTQTVPLLIEKSPTRSGDITKNIIVNSSGTLADEKKEKKRNANAEKDSYSRTSPRTRILQEKRMSKTVHSALTTKYYSRFNIIFCCLTYLSLAGILAGQIYLKVALDNAINDLKVRKDLISNSQIRDFNLVSIYRTCRFAWDLGTGQIQTSQLGAAAFSASTYINATLSSLPILANANQDIFVNTGWVNEDIRQNLFRKDVRIYDAELNGQENSTNFTSFQATDLIVQTGFKAMTKAKMDMMSSKVEMDFIFRNALNDLFIKAEESSDLFVSLIQDQINETTESIRLLLIAEAVILVTLSICLFWVTVRQYLQEKINLFSLMKLDKKKIQDLQTKFSNFQKSLESGSFNEGLLFSKMSTQLDFVKKLENQKNIQTPNLKGIKKKYSLYVGKSLFCFLIILAFILWTSLSGSKLVKALGNEQTKLYFASDIATKTNFAFLVSQEVFATNNAAIIMNEDPLSQLKESISDLTQMRNNAIQVFLDENHEYEPTINTILFVNGCQLLNSSTQPYCAIVQKKALKTNLLSLLSDYEMQMTDKLEGFLSSNRTTQSLRSIQTENYDLILSMQRILADESTLLSQIVDANFEQNFENLKTQASIGLGVFFSIFIFIVYLLWILTIKEIIESDNKFKQVLRTFPPEMILSNFGLKTFINRTSNEALKLLKNHI